MRCRAKAAAMSGCATAGRNHLSWRHAGCSRVSLGVTGCESQQNGWSGNSCVLCEFGFARVSAQGVTRALLSGTPGRAEGAVRSAFSAGSIFLTGTFSDFFQPRTRSEGQKRKSGRMLGRVSLPRKERDGKRMVYVDFNRGRWTGFCWSEGGRTGRVKPARPSRLSDYFPPWCEAPSMKLSMLFCSIGSAFGFRYSMCPTG